MIQSPLNLVPYSDVFSDQEYKSLLSSWNDAPPEGKFLKDRHGYTHFVLDKPETEVSVPSEKGMIVLAHGLGTFLTMYQSVANSLTKEGYSVLRYDYYNHGYSKYEEEGKDMWVKYTPDLFVDQLEDLLQHVTATTGEVPYGIVGHSTGGIVSIAYQDRWGVVGEGQSSDMRPFPKVALVAPALYANKPFIARVADKIPTLMTFLMKYLPFARFIIGDAYLDANENSFARDPKSKAILYEDAYKSNKETFERLFGKKKGVFAHPFLSAGLLGINAHTLRGDLLPNYGAMLVKTLNNTVGRSEVKMLWGELDKTVRFDDKDVAEVRIWAERYSNLSVEDIPNIGHEVFMENSDLISGKIISFLNS